MHTPLISCHYQHHRRLAQHPLRFPNPGARSPARRSLPQKRPQSRHPTFLIPARLGLPSATLGPSRRSATRPAPIPPRRFIPLVAPSPIPSSHAAARSELLRRRLGRPRAEVLRPDPPNTRELIHQFAIVRDSVPSSARTLRSHRRRPQVSTCPRRCR